MDSPLPEHGNDKLYSLHSSAGIIYYVGLSAIAEIDAKQTFPIRS